MDRPQTSVQYEAPALVSPHVPTRPQIVLPIPAHSGPAPTQTPEYHENGPLYSPSPMQMSPRYCKSALKFDLIDLWLKATTDDTQSRINLPILRMSSILPSPDVQ